MNFDFEFEGWQAIAFAVLLLAVPFCLGLLVGLTLGAN